MVVVFLLLRMTIGCASSPESLSDTTTVFDLRFFVGVVALGAFFLGVGGVFFDANCSLLPETLERAVEEGTTVPSRATATDGRGGVGGCGFRKEAQGIRWEAERQRRTRPLREMRQDV